MSFADSLTAILEDNEKERRKKAESAVSQWSVFEGKVIDRCVVKIKEACTAAAKLDKESASLNLSTGGYLPLTTELHSDGPRSFTLKVDWTKTSSKIGVALPPGAWWYATRGVSYKESLTAPAGKDEVFTHFITKVVDRIGTLGFKKVDRKGLSVTVSWRKPEEPPAKRARVESGNLKLECGICHVKKNLSAGVPCGHLCCGECLQKATFGFGGKCPFCKQPVREVQALYKP